MTETTEENPCIECTTRKHITNPEKLLHVCAYCKHRDKVIELQKKAIKQRTAEEKKRILDEVQRNKSFY